MYPLGPRKQRMGGRVVYGSGLENRQPARVRGFESHPIRQPQHSTTLTASPPSEVSLYLCDMSSPVWRIVATT